MAMLVVHLLVTASSLGSNPDISKQKNVLLGGRRQPQECA